MSNKNRIQIIILGIILIGIVIIFIFIVGGRYDLNNDNIQETNVDIALENETPYIEPEPRIQEVEIQIHDTFYIEFDEINAIDDLPAFIELDNNLLTINPTKDNIGNHTITLEDINEEVILNINIVLPQVKWSSLENELRNFLGNQIDRYGIYIYDLKREENFGINEHKIFPPASSAKITIAVLVLRDIDAGIYFLDSTYPIQNAHKNSFSNNLGVYPEGAQVTLDKYLRELIINSNNTAWYHLVALQGHSYQSVNPRTIEELGVNPLFMDPYQGTARNLGKVFKDIYLENTLSHSSSHYLISLMENATPFNREGLSLDIPNNLKFANKLGYHWTHDLVNFVDTAIIWGNSTNYVVSVLNEGVDWNTGKRNLEGISSIIHRHIDNS